MSDRKHSKREEITVLNEGPIYICEVCNALLKVPDSCLKEEEIQEEGDDGPCTVTLWTFNCPKCGEENIADEDDGSEESDEEEEREREKKERHEKHEKHDKKEKKEKSEKSEKSEKRR
jgi:hypothetical protein